MSIDKPSGSGDHRPDQTPRPEHKPFPGQPDNRPTAPPPTGTKTPDELRADRAKYKTTSEYNAAKTLEKAAAPRPGTGDAAAVKDTTAARPPAGTQAAVDPGTRSRTGAMADNAPARGDSGGQRHAAPPDRGPVPGTAAPAARRPETLRGPDRVKHRPFPGEPDNRPPAPPPTGTKTPDELRADRAKYKTTSEYNAAKAAEKTTAEQAGAKEAPVNAKESRAARPGTAAAPERSTSSRDQGRTGSGEAQDATAPAREPSVPPDKTRAAQADRHDPGNDKHPGLIAQTDKTSRAGQDISEARVPEGSHPLGNAGLPHSPYSYAAHQGDKGGILHGHSEFHGQKLDLYTDGTRWAGGDAVRAAQAEAARARAEGQPSPQRHDITDIPQMRDLGRNTVGDKEDRSPGDTSDLPPSGDELLKMEDTDASAVKQLRGKFYKDFGDMADAGEKMARTAQQLFDGPGSVGHAETHTAGPYISPTASQHAMPDPGSIAELGFVVGVLATRGTQLLHDKFDGRKK